MFDYEYDSEMFRFEDGDVEVYTLHNHVEDHNISEDEIEDAVDTYYASVGYSTDTKELINLVMNLFEGSEE